MLYIKQNTRKTISLCFKVWYP